jgi:RNA polymerase sigma-70 factor (ECF subfamily)
VWQRLGSWRGDAAFSSWIHRVTVNLVLSNVRSEKRRLNKEMNESEMESRKTDSGQRQQEPSVPLSTIRTPAVLDAIDLEHAIAKLPDGARAVFVLHDVEGYQHDEIAKMMGTAEGTCRAQLHRARKLLMESLDR